MKTSFYFVLWIIVYPVLGLFNNSLINDNAFIVALAIVWGLSWLLNRIMPNTLNYERASEVAPILEDVYTGNVSSFRKRLSRQAAITTITALYFIITTAVIAYATFKAGVSDWIALVVFAIFTISTISRSASLVKAKTQLDKNPTAEQCMEIADGTYDLDYASYYEAHNGVSYNDMLPSKPKFFKIFRIFSTIVALIASLLGLLYIVSAIVLMFSNTSIEVGAVAGMYFLYGSLATYFGIRDFISCIQKNPASN